MQQALQFFWGRKIKVADFVHIVHSKEDRRDIQYEMIDKWTEQYQVEGIIRSS